MGAIFICMAIPSGNLRHIVSIETATRVQSPQSGDEIETWPPTGGTTLTIPGEFAYLGSREFPESFKTFAETTARCRIRYTSTTALIDPATHRLSFDGKTWDILGIIPDPNKTALTIELAARK